MMGVLSGALRNIIGILWNYLNINVIIYWCLKTIPVLVGVNIFGWNDVKLYLK